ncbi:hypothetical protein [Spirosoma montaniterrae]|uniref:Uncharacterized protein n=1 Tax=Spirosoma montaniterrae TaxID=1178516 RepID=A0A1P9X0K0_9BACT|nr:hypothetical protein [Spirosoma montaniterrae]AQG81113.1 hypothetical protein AWR27_18370 [Spirosoma montaniterrae]
MTAYANLSVSEDIIRDLGYQTIDDFLRIQARRALEQKISYYQSRVDFYERKYGMSFTEFRQRIQNAADETLAPFSVIEKEDDDNDWDDALDFIRIYTADLLRIRP